MMKRLLMAASLTIVSLTIEAQESLRNSLTVAVTIGSDTYTSAKAQVCYNAAGYTPDNANWQDRKMMTGIELGWFATEEIKVALGGGFNYRCVPGFEETSYAHGCDMGICSGTSYLDAEKQISYHAYLSGNYYIRTGIERLKAIAGVKGDWAHCISKLTPTYTGSYSTSVSGQSSQTVSNRHHTTTGKAEAFDIKGALTIGAEYFITRNFYAGVQADLGSFTYSVARTLPSDSKMTLKGEAYNASFLSCPMLKIGFAF